LEEDLISLQDAFLLLKKENRFVQGYLRRNFSFAKRNGMYQGQEKNKKGTSDDQNACIVM
jgi:hypothetical protein